MAKTKKRRGLGGLGVDVLLSSSQERQAEPQEHENSENVKNIAVDLIDRSPYQPRLRIDAEALEPLAESIRVQGVVQPIIVRKQGQRYELIAGERRWRASQLAGLDEVPAVIKKVEDQQAAAIALIENIQREDLNPIEEAVAISNLIKQFGWTHQEVAQEIGKARTTVSNSLRLLDLHDDVKEHIQKGELEMGHSRALLGLEPKAQAEIARRVVEKGLSVRETERLVRARKNPAPVAKSANKSKDPDIERLEHEISDRLGAPVSVEYTHSKGKGSLRIRYNSLDELEGILDKIRA